MPEGLEIGLAPERLDEGSPEERAAFGVFTIRAGELALTEGFDFWTKGYRPGPLISSYHAAEWLAWNWWRLRWEPPSISPGWWRAHKMNSIGEGYLWPNLSISSDGMRTALISQPSSRPDAKPFRYVGANPCIVPSSVFEAAVDAFIPQILGRLRDAGIEETNLDRVWRDILAERSDPDTALRRKFEALLGTDPDEGDTGTIEQLLRDAEVLGKDPMGEIAAAHRPGQEVLAAAALRRTAENLGFAVSGDLVRLTPGTVPLARADVPAWRLGARAAQALRHQQNLGNGPISDYRLPELAGVVEKALEASADVMALSFILDEGGSGGRVVLRPKWQTGRRFELARLLGDRLVSPIGGRFFLATRSSTFRQKAQRSFAAEFLAPFEEVDARLDGDYSEERRQEVAAEFNVSEWTVSTLLVNHRRLEHLDQEGDAEAA